jgi:hypothetical protein
MADQNLPRPPGSQIVFTNARLHECFLEAGTRRLMKLCLKCLGETDFLHRVSFLNCKSTCVLCDKRGHIGQVCPLMETTYRSFFTRTWWLEHCDLGGICPWEENGLELLQEAGDAYTRNQKPSSQAPGTHRDPRRGTSSRGPRGHYRNDRDSRSLSPSRGNNGRRGGRNVYRSDRYDGGRRGGNNHGNRGRNFANADSSRSMGNTVAYQPDEPTPQSEGPVWREPARKALLDERMRLKRELKQQELEPVDSKSQLEGLVKSQSDQITKLQQQLTEMEQNFQQQLQTQVEQQIIQLLQEVLQSQQRKTMGNIGLGHVPQQSGSLELSGLQSHGSARSQHSTGHVPAASGLQNQQSTDRSIKLEEDADAHDRPWAMRRRQGTGMQDIGRPRDGRHD